MKYYVSWTETTVYRGVIEADSKEEAEELFDQDDISEIYNQSYAEGLESTHVEAEPYDGTRKGYKWPFIRRTYE